MICTVCGTACPEGAKFCMECGAAFPLPEAPVPEEPVMPTSPETDFPAAPAPEELPPEDSERDSAPAEIRPQTDQAQDPATSASEPFPVDQAQPQAPPPGPPVPVKKGTHWIPIAIMAVLCVFGFVLFLVLPFGSVDTPMLSNSETPWFYNDNGTLHFFEEYYNGPEELTVPEVVDGEPVTALATGCFFGCDFTTVILPDTLKTINPYAFDSCTSMRGIFLPEGLVFIGDKAFYCCSELEAICIPSTVETIQPGAFDGCFSLNHIFYNGIHSHWLDLYKDMIGKKTQVYCTDGTFVHRKVFP